MSRVQNHSTRPSSDLLPIRVARIGLGLAVVSSLLAFAVRVQAQQPSPPAINIRPVVGAIVGTGDQADALKNSVLVGGQALRNVPNAGAQTNVLGYGAVGLDLDHAGGNYGLRLEARDNVTGFKGFRGELADRKTRNDLQFSAGLTFGF